MGESESSAIPSQQYLKEKIIKRSTFTQVDVSVCVSVFFIPAKPRVALHIYHRGEGRGVALFQANL